MHSVTQGDNGEKAVSTCLVIDDDTFDRHMIKRCVGRERPDMRLYECSTLSEARNFLEQASADLILIDNRLPDGLGADYAQELRNDSRMADAVICVVTGDDLRSLDSDIAALSKDRLSTRTIWDMVSGFLAEREILRSSEKAQLVAEFGDQMGENLAPGMARMLRTLRMSRARVARRDPQKAIDELDKLEEMLIAMSEVVCGGVQQRRPTPEA
ncbi:response regulator [Antarctobacter sp.]|uniref:response regulator n=1 Tax=Antarctobacter sp. TaxID=1872577 RepID=UPI002B270456|nr:response regulator [Antarctobacter sp.]